MEVIYHQENCSDIDQLKYNVNSMNRVMQEIINNINKEEPKEYFLEYFLLISLNSSAFKIIDSEIKTKYFTQILNKSKHDLLLKNFKIFILKLRTLDHMLDVEDNSYATISAFIIMSLIENHSDILLEIVHGVIDGKISWKTCLYGLEYYIDCNKNYRFYGIGYGISF